MLKAAVIGLGWWGQTILRMVEGSPKIRVVRVMTRSRAGSEMAQARALPISTHYREVLSDPAVEAVILCTPHSTHLELVLSAARSRKHVFCEKPLALSRRDAEAAIAACNAAGVTLGIGHERRFEPAILELRRRVETGELGELLQMEATFSQDKFLALEPGNWRFSAAEAPAGPLTGTGIHMLDLAISFLGPAERVFASVKNLSGRIPNGDTLAILALFKSGAQALIGAVLATPFDGRFALYGREGWADMRDRSHPEAPSGMTLSVCHKGGRRESLDFAASSSVRANLEAFADAALGTSPYPMSQKEMVWNIAALEAVCKSAESGRVEPVES
jgi:predicted dehydrogenase